MKEFQEMLIKGGTKGGQDEMVLNSETVDGIIFA
jgi:hypothetical protein